MSVKLIAHTQLATKYVDELVAGFATDEQWETFVAQSDGAYLATVYARAYPHIVTFVFDQLGHVVMYTLAELVEMVAVPECSMVDADALREMVELVVGVEPSFAPLLGVRLGD